MEEKYLHVTIMDSHGVVRSHYSGAISDPKMSRHYQDYLDFMSRDEMGGDEGIHIPEQDPLFQMDPNS